MDDSYMIRMETRQPRTNFSSLDWTTVVDDNCVLPMDTPAADHPWKPAWTTVVGFSQHN